MKIAFLVFVILSGALFIIQAKFGSQPSVSSVPLEKQSILSGMKSLSGPKIVDTLSGDGTMKASLRSQEKPDGTVDYSLFISDSSGKGSRLLYTKTIQKGSIELPKNSWAPDNKYLFIRDKEIGDNYLVFKANGDPFTNGDKFINGTLLFKQKQPAFVLLDMTGWDGIGLMHTRAVNGASFWFEVDSQRFIQLAR